MPAGSSTPLVVLLVYLKRAALLGGQRCRESTESIGWCEWEGSSCDWPRGPWGRATGKGAARHWRWSLPVGGGRGLAGERRKSVAPRSSSMEEVVAGERCGVAVGAASGASLGCTCPSFRSLNSGSRGAPGCWGPEAALRRPGLVPGGQPLRVWAYPPAVCGQRRRPGPGAGLLEPPPCGVPCHRSRILLPAPYLPSIPPRSRSLCALTVGGGADEVRRAGSALHGRRAAAVPV